MDIFDLAQTFRAKLLAGEAAEAARLTSAYIAMYEQLRPDIERVLADLAGGDQSLTTLFQTGRLDEVLFQVREQLNAYAERSSSSITARQVEVARLAAENARALAMAQLSPGTIGKVKDAPEGFGPTWKTVPVKTIEQLAGFTTSGTPLDRVLQQLVPHGVDRVKQAMLVGAGLGQSPEQVADGVKDALGGNLGHFLTLQRTAEMQAYREATRLSFEENEDVIAGWRWMASLSFDTCLACLSKHGTFHKISERMASHYNCRCVAVPETKSFAELGATGLDDLSTDWESGEGWLNRQSEENQKRTMGPTKFEAWKAGKAKPRPRRWRSSSSTRTCRRTATSGR